MGVQAAAVYAFRLPAYQVSSTHTSEVQDFVSEGKKETFFMQTRSEDSSLPQVMNMNPTDLIQWCKKRKQFLGLSNQRLSDESGVPVGTIDRIMSGSYTEFRYSSIQPIVTVLIGFEEDTPKPENADSKQIQNYFDTIEGYKLVVEQKNYIIEELKRTCEQLSKEVTFLKTENDHKHEAILRQLDHVRWLEKMVDDLRK